MTNEKKTTLKTPLYPKKKEEDSKEKHHYHVSIAYYVIGYPLLLQYYQTEVYATSMYTALIHGSSKFSVEHAHDCLYISTFRASLYDTLSVDTIGIAPIPSPKEKNDL